MNIAFIGTGYVGLVTGTCFADLGNNTICVDNNDEKLACLNRGESPFFEPGLSERITRNHTAGRLHFSNDLPQAVKESEIIFIAVGTPSSDDGSADLSAVFSVAETVAETIQQLNDGVHRILVTKSTVPVGTGQKIKTLLATQGVSDAQLSVVSNPEFLREGSAIHDFFHPDRIVLGGDNDEALKKVATLYEPLYLNETPIVTTSLESSELSKYGANAMLATKISFINEMANLCEAVGADIQDVAKIMGMDKRIGKFFLHPGPGYGGSCFPKDTKALVKIGEDAGSTMNIVNMVETVNERQKTHHIPRLKEVLGGLSGKTIALLGVAFKPQTDDIREAPALAIIQVLLDEGATIQAFDPEAMDNAKAHFNNHPDLTFTSSSYDAAMGADAILLVTEWNAFRELDLAQLKALVKQPFFFDLRNVYTQSKLEEVGFNAYIIGHSTKKTLQTVKNTLE